MHVSVPWRRSRRSTAAAVGALLGAFVLVGALLTQAGPFTAGQGERLQKGTQQDIAGNYGEPQSGPAKEGDDGEGPGGAAEAAYAARAYPATSIPFSATQNAINAWNGLISKSNKGKNKAGQWTLAGPSNASYPGVLSFSGANYTASGRVTALAIDPNCSRAKCQVWVGAAGGGIWGTKNALSGNGTSWTYLSGSFGTNAIGTLVYADGVLYAGTGEPNASGDSEAGLGIYKSTDGGHTWTHLAADTTIVTPAYSGSAFDSRSISSIVVDPANADHLYVSTTRGVRGVSSVTGGATTSPPSAAPFGLYESTDGGATFNFIWDGAGSVRGVNEVELDPNFASNDTLYAAAFQQGIWRSTDAGTTWTQIKPALNPGLNTDRASFAVTQLPNGDTRMYVGDGNQGPEYAHFYRSDDVAAGTPVFADMTTIQNYDYCTGQCWYDNVVYSPPGQPDVVYLGGSYDYGTYGWITNGRAFLRSTDAGESFTDMTWDANNTPNGMHPDSHAIVAIPGTDAAIFGSDGGLMRTSGAFADISSECAPRGVPEAYLADCQQLLSAVPTRLYDMNKGLPTLQFQSLSVAADNPKHLQGGTQDNGTFETMGSSVTWPQIMYGDGGQSGFNVSDSSMRFNSFYGQYHDANFENGAPTKWVIISGPIVSSNEGSNFYAPIIADPNPATAGSIFEGSQSVWRTQDWGGDPAYLEANCPEFTTSGADPNCGDFVRIGPDGQTDLTAAGYGTRAGGFVAAIARTASNTGTMWVATTTGRVFISQNANDAADAVTYTRLDTLDASAPERFVSGITIDPANPNHAWISYSGYSTNTPSQPGHVFEVTYDPSAGTATWTSLDGSGSTAFPDFPATGIAYDSVTGDLYVSNDFGVMRLPHGSSDWEVAGKGLPMVEVAGLTIAPDGRKLYAATHGLSAWQLTLP